MSTNARSLWEHAAFARRPRKNRAAAKRKTARIVGDRLPRELEVLMGRANRDYVRGSYASAVTSLREALELNPSLVEAWVTIGRIHGESGRHHDALAALNYAAEKVRRSLHFTVVVCALPFSHRPVRLLCRKKTMASCGFASRGFHGASAASESPSWRGVRSGWRRQNLLCTMLCVKTKHSSWWRCVSFEE